MIIPRFPAVLLAVSFVLMSQGETKSPAKRGIKLRGTSAKLVVTVEHLNAEENREVLRIGNAGTVPDQNERGFSIPFHSGDLGTEATALVPFDEKGTVYSLSDDETTCGFMEKTASSSRRVCCVVAKAGGALMTYPNVNFQAGELLSEEAPEITAYDADVFRLSHVQGSRAFLYGPCRVGKTRRVLNVEVHLDSDGKVSLTRCTLEKLE